MPQDNPDRRKCPLCNTELVPQLGHSIGSLHAICPKCNICPDCEDGAV